MPVEDLKTGGAKPGVFLIRISDSRRRVHHAAPVPAVGESKGMTQFMERRLYNTRDEEISVWWLSVKLGKKSTCRNQ
jgi:hypothetical protein